MYGFLKAFCIVAEPPWRARQDSPRVGRETWPWCPGDVRDSRFSAIHGSSYPGNTTDVSRGAVSHSAHGYRGRHFGRPSYSQRYCVCTRSIHVYLTLAWIVFPKKFIADSEIVFSFNFDDTKLDWWKFVVFWIPTNVCTFFKMQQFFFQISV